MFWLLCKFSRLQLFAGAALGWWRPLSLTFTLPPKNLQELPATHKKRPPAIREAGIDSWQISAAPVQHPGEGDSAEGEYDAAAALATDAPGPLEAALPEGAPGRLSRATSLTLAAGPLQHGAKALSRQNSFSEAGGEEAAGAPLRSARRQLHNLQSNATSYESAVEMHSDAEHEEAAAAAAGSQGRLLSIPPTPEGPAADDTAGAEAPAEGEVSCSRVAQLLGAAGVCALS